MRRTDVTPVLGPPHKIGIAMTIVSIEFLSYNQFACLHKSGQPRGFNSNMVSSAYSDPQNTDLVTGVTSGVIFQKWA